MMITEPEMSSSPQYRGLCGVLASLDLTQPESIVVIKPEIKALLDSFSELDWDLFVHMAKAEGVAPLTHFTLSRSTYKAPEAVSQKLSLEYYKSAAFNQMILEEMGKVVQTLTEANVSVGVLKGAALAITIYPDPALRPMTDLDLLVKIEDFEKAKGLILSMGYHETIPEITKGFNRFAGYHSQLNKSDNPSIKIELHWSLVAGENDVRSPSAGWFWQNIYWGGCPVHYGISIAKLQMLSKEALLLYLAGHLILQHGKAASRIIWFYDIALIIKSWKSELNWYILFEEADKLGYLPVLRFVIEKINTEFEVDFPINEIPKGKFISNYRTEFLVNLLWKGKSGRLINALSRLIATRGWKKLYLLIGYFFPDVNYMQWRYRFQNRWQVIYYYPLRWIQMFIKGMRTIVEHWV